MRNFTLQNTFQTSALECRWTYGMGIKSRAFQGFRDFRYGFNGKEKTDEINGEGNSYDFGARIYDPRLGRFLSVDPLSNEFPESSPYLFGNNNPIFNIDIEGLAGFPHLKKGETAFIVKINDKEIYVILNEKTPHKVVLSDGKKRETFNFVTKVDPKNFSQYKRGNKEKKKFILAQNNSQSLAFFPPQSDKFQESAVDVKLIRSLEFKGIKVLDILKEAVKQNNLEINIVGNVSTNSPAIIETDAKLNEFTKNRAEATKNELFGGKDEDIGKNINTFGIIDALSDDQKSPKAKFSTVSPKNFDALGVQIFFNKAKSTVKIP